MFEITSIHKIKCVFPDSLRAELQGHRATPRDAWRTTWYQGLITPGKSYIQSMHSSSSRHPPPHALIHITIFHGFSSLDNSLAQGQCWGCTEKPEWLHWVHQSIGFPCHKSICQGERWLMPAWWWLNRQADLAHELCRWDVGAETGQEKP